MTVETQFQNLFLERFAPFINPLPYPTSVRKLFPLVPPSERNGLKMSYPVKAAFSHGQTVSNSGAISTLNAARPGVTLKAEIDATNLFMREQISYDSHMRGLAGASKKGGAAASYWKPYDKIVRDMQEGMEFYTELALLYGPGTGGTILDDIGVVASTPVAGGSATDYDGGTGPVVQLTKASWSAGLWNNAGNGGETGSGMLVDVLNSAGTALVETNVEIIGVADPSLCQVKMLGGDTGGVTVTAGHRFLPAGWYQKQAVGYGGILANTGTFANISAASNGFWRARSATPAGPLTAAKLLQYLAKMHANGVRGGMVGIIHALHFSDFVNQADELIRWTTQNGGASTDVKVFGTDSIEFMSAVGKVTLINHQFQKQGQAWFFPRKETVRVGACDITMRGIDDGKIFLELENKTGSEIRSMAQQASMIKVPAHALRVYGITPTGEDTSGS